jgi:hypothetical protein
MDEAKYLYGSRTPAQYIDRSLEIKLSSGKKATITREWLKKTGFTVKDIQYARHRHSYWKKQKRKGHYERIRKRLDQHMYSNGEHLQWDEKMLRDFIARTDKFHDYELAKHFRTTIPSIQYLRRKYYCAKLILTKQNKRISTEQIYRLMQNSEKILVELAHAKRTTPRSFDQLK